MTIILNILWLTLGAGLLTSILYLIFGLLLCITIIGIPFGIQCFKLAELSLCPFGREITQSSSFSSPPSLLLNILWILIIGIEIATIHLIISIILFLSVIGIPFAIQHLKLLWLGLIPFGQQTQDID